MPEYKAFQFGRELVIHESAEEARKMMLSWDPELSLEEPAVELTSRQAENITLPYLGHDTEAGSLADLVRHHNRIQSPIWLTQFN